MRVLSALFLMAAAMPLIAAEPITGLVVPAKQATVTPSVEGVVLEVMVRVGHHVRKGQVLARLDNSQQQQQLEQAMAEYRIAAERYELVKARAHRDQAKMLDAQLAEGHARLQLAQHSYERIKKLVEAKVVSEEEVVEREHELRIAKTQLEQLKAERASVDEQRPEQAALAQSEVMLTKLALEAARRRAERGTLRSRIDGTVLKQSLQVGALARPGEASILVADTRQFIVRASAPEERLRDLEEGVACRIKTVAGELDGAVREIAPLVEDGRIGFVIELDAADADLLPGMKATITLQMRDLKD